MSRRALEYVLSPSADGHGHGHGHGHGLVTMRLAMNSDFQKNPKFQVLPRVTYNHFGEGL